MKPVLVFVALALTGAVIAEGVLLRRQEKRLRELEASVSRQAAPEGAAGIARRDAASSQPDAAAPHGETPAPPAPAAREALDAAVAERTALLEKRLASLEKSAAAPAAGGASPADIEAAVAKKLDEKLEKEKKDGGPFGDGKKRPLADVSKDLGLTQEQEDRMASAIEASQRKLFDTLTTPRNDGTNVLDDVVEAMRDPDHREEKGKAIMVKLFTEKIPGTDEAYLSRIMLEKNALNEEFRTILTEDQMKKYERLGQDPHDIQTGYDPFGQYVAERMGKK